MLFHFAKHIYRYINHLKNSISFTYRYGVRYYPIASYLEIIGWLTEKEAIALYDLVLKLPKASTRAVEIGSWLGKSSFIITKGLMENCQKPKLYCIDPFNADGDIYSKNIYKDIASDLKKSENQSLKQHFLQNMHKYKVSDIIQTLEGYSFDFAKRFTERIDFLFIDGNHEYKAVLKDFRDWSKFIKKGGIIAFHDVDFDPYGKPTGKEDNVGPGLVVQKYIINSPGWTNLHRIDGLFYATKKN